MGRGIWVCGRAFDPETFKESLWGCPEGEMPAHRGFSGEREQKGGSRRQGQARARRPRLTSHAAHGTSQEQRFTWAPCARNRTDRADRRRKKSCVRFLTLSSRRWATRATSGGLLSYRKRSRRPPKPSQGLSLRLQCTEGTR